MESEKICELQMCWSLKLLIIQSLKLNVAEVINPKNKAKNKEKLNFFATQWWRL